MAGLRLLSERLGAGGKRLVVFLVGWGVLPARARRLWLLVGSWLFYASWEPVFLLLLLFSTVLDYRIGLWLASESDARRRKLGLRALLG